MVAQTRSRRTLVTLGIFEQEELVAWVDLHLGTMDELLGLVHHGGTLETFVELEAGLHGHSVERAGAHDHHGSAPNQLTPLGSHEGLGRIQRAGMSIDGRPKVGESYGKRLVVQTPDRVCRMQGKEH